MELVTLEGGNDTDMSYPKVVKEAALEKLLIMNI